MRKLHVLAALVATSAFSTFPVFAANELDSQNHMINASAQNASGHWAFAELGGTVYEGDPPASPADSAKVMAAMRSGQQANSADNRCIVGSGYTKLRPFEIHAAHPSSLPHNGV